jgi:hypothetical protein
MLTQVHPKLPMRNKEATKNYYVQKLGFTEIGSADYDGYLMLEKDAVELHFFPTKITGRSISVQTILSVCINRY